MEDFISAAGDSLADFLNQKKSAAHSFQNGEILISFIYPLNQISGRLSIDDLLKNHDPLFYFEKPDEEFKITGISKTAEIIESGSQRFSSADKKIKEYKEKCLNNWEAHASLNIPLLFGAVKFTPEHDEQEWKNFGDSDWIIPELIFIEEKKKNYIVFNSIASSISLFKNLPAQLMKIMENIFLIDEEKKTQPKERAKITKIEGNLPKDKKKWRNQINELIEEISADNIKKVVLSRKVELLLTDEFSFSEILIQLSKRYPNCYIFLYKNGESVFFGASPEKLMKYQDETAEFDIFAGSAPRGITADEDTALENQLLISSKNINEHKIVLDYILNSVRPFTENLMASHTQVKKYSNIQHLWTRVTAKLKPGFSMHSLLKAVYPTPSICGMPKEKALALIKKLEIHKRGLYSGLLGWMNFNNSGEFIIAIRSALYYRRKLAVFAGNGIVKESNPEDEWKETELKLNPILLLFS